MFKNNLNLISHVSEHIQHHSRGAKFQDVPWNEPDLPLDELTSRLIP